ncbi:MAG: sigma-70 family RNA polymerase sigma factor [Acidimicrobiia bacterium]
METPEVEPSSKEQELIVRAQSGDKAAFAALVREHGNEVYTLARRLVGDPHLAADIAQETLIRAWKALPKFRGDAALSTWLHRITVNTAWTQRNRARRHRAQPLDEYAELAAPYGSEHPEVAGEILELRGRLRAALDSLPDSHRQVVVLKDVYGWSHAEIAETMEISVSAAKVRLHRARGRLARKLEESA